MKLVSSPYKRKVHILQEKTKCSFLANSLMGYTLPYDPKMRIYRISFLIDFNFLFSIVRLNFTSVNRTFRKIDFCDRELPKVIMDVSLCRA